MSVILPLRVRTDIEANWVLGNPVLQKWELGYSSDGNNFKIWDWVKTWTTLSNAFTAWALWAFKWKYTTAAARDAAIGSLTTGDLILLNWAIQTFNGTWFTVASSNWTFNNVVANIVARNALTWLSIWDAVFVKDEWIVYEWNGTVFNAIYDVTPVTKKVYADIATMNADTASLVSWDLVTNKQDWLIYKYNWTSLVLTVKINPIRETPTGVVDWTNAIFNTSLLAQWNMIDLYINGMLQEEWFDYTKTTWATNYTITTTVAPLVGDRIRVSYLSQ